jgi:hypothetical protein
VEEVSRVKQMLKVIDVRSERVVHAATNDDGTTECGKLIRTVCMTRHNLASTITCSACAAKLKH